MSLKVNINGQLFDKEDAKISVYDHGLLYGDGVFEGMRSYGGKVFRLRAHLDRLWESAQAIGLQIPMTTEDPLYQVHQALSKSSRQGCHALYSANIRPALPTAGGGE